MSAHAIEQTLQVMRALERDGIALSEARNVLQVLPYADVVIWARSHAGPITVEALRKRFPVSKATGYRWYRMLVAEHQEAAPRLGDRPLQFDSPAVGRARAGDVAGGVEQ